MAAKTAIMDLISKKTDKLMYAIIYYLCAKFEQDRQMHVREMVEDVLDTRFFYN